MKTFIKKVLQYTSELVAVLLVYGGFAWLSWWLFDEEIKQVTAIVIDTLDKIF